MFRRLDSLNKELDPWYVHNVRMSISRCLYFYRDSQYYMGEFRNLCTKEKMHVLNWPERDYIVQIARFDPAKGNSLGPHLCNHAHRYLVF